MHPIFNIADQPLVWVQPSSAERAYELRAGNRTIATLSWPKGVTAEARAAGEAWLFEQTGFWHRRVQATRRDTTAQTTTFDPGWTGGGALTLATGRRVRWGADNILRSRWSWRAADGAPLARMERRHDPSGVVGRVEVEPGVAMVPELALLLPFGWFLLLVQARDSDDGANVATFAATAGS